MDTTCFHPSTVLQQVGMAGEESMGIVDGGDKTREEDKTKRSGTGDKRKSKYRSEGEAVKGDGR